VLAGAHVREATRVTGGSSLRHNRDAGGNHRLLLCISVPETASAVHCRRRPVWPTSPCSRPCSLAELETASAAFTFLEAGLALAHWRLQCAHVSPKRPVLCGPAGCAMCAVRKLWRITSAGIGGAEGSAAGQARKQQTSCASWRAPPQLARPKRRPRLIDRRAVTGLTEQSSAVTALSLAATGTPTLHNSRRCSHLRKSSMVASRIRLFARNDAAAALGGGAGAARAGLDRR
jgi:hypothetical protein